MQNKPRLTFWQIWNMSFGFMGIQIGFALQQANMSPIYKYLGAEESNLPYLWLAGPITGLLIQPVIGAMSDRTWNKLGRRRPFFLVGAILSSICLLLMPFSSAVWMAAGLLWILDFSINTSMEPFRAFVGDKLPEEQRTTGFVMQSFFIGIGQTLANAAPFILTALGVTGVMASGIPHATLWAFIIGAVCFLGAVLWTVFTADEYPPADMEEFRRKQAEGNVVGKIVKEIIDALKNMPTTMKQLAVVQFFTWFALPCMWQFYGLTVARHVFAAPDEKSPLFVAGTEWGGLSFAVYNVACFLVAFLLPKIANATSRKMTHFICLTCGGLGLLSTFFAHDKYFLWIGMVGVGIAWASILSMPYVFKTRDGRAVLGASLGGITSVWAGLKYPETFSRIGGQSSSFWIDDRRVIKELEKLDARKLPFRFYFDTGTLEGVENSRRVNDLLRGKGFPVVYEEGETGHNWTSWRDRLADAFIALWK